jgi:hypothetical protein
VQCFVQVIVGNMPWRFSSYMAYCDNGAAQDEMPLYLFDKVRRQQQQRQQHKCSQIIISLIFWQDESSHCIFDQVCCLVSSSSRSAFPLSALLIS